MEWSPLEVALDGMFCDAVGMATDGYFCERRRVVAPGVAEHVGLDRRQRDQRDIADIVTILLERMLI